MPKKDIRVIPVQTRTNEHYQRIQHIRISLSTNFRLKQTVVIFRPNLRIKGISSPKWDKLTSPSNSAYFSYARHKVSCQTDNLDALDQIRPERVFLVYSN